MSWTDILIIGGCVAAGYWIVSNVMGPGIDITRQKPPTQPADEKRLPVATPRKKNPHVADWYVILDVPRTSNRGEIEAAFRRQQSKAQAEGDAIQLERLRQAREAALASAK